VDEVVKGCVIQGCEIYMQTHTRNIVYIRNAIKFRLLLGLSSRTLRFDSTLVHVLFLVETVILG
jgi:hypothetical protein